MTTQSLYDITIPVWTKALTGLSWVLCKAEEHYKAAGRNPDDLLGDRIIADMEPFGFQVAQAVNQSLGAFNRLTGRGDTFIAGFDSLAAARAAVADALKTFKATKPEDLAGAETRPISWDPRGTGGFKFNGAGEYLLPFAMPNFWFHTTMAYALARKNGVPVGKRDFMAFGEAPAGVEPAAA